MPETFTWETYNTAQRGREPRPLLALALAARDAPPGIAIDLGCGAGVETSALLAAGWTVHAVDSDTSSLRRLEQDVPPDDVARLHLHESGFGDLGELPPSDLVHSSYALPYCAPEHFDAVWASIRTALLPGAVLACQLFGPHDSLAGTAGVTTHSRAQVLRLVAGLEIVHWEEEDADGNAFSGPKHWHVFHVVARRGAVD